MSPKYEVEKQKLNAIELKLCAKTEFEDSPAFPRQMGGTP